MGIASGVGATLLGTIQVQDPEVREGGYVNGSSKTASAARGAEQRDLGSGGGEGVSTRYLPLLWRRNFRDRLEQLFRDLGVSSAMRRWVNSRCQPYALNFRRLLPHLHRRSQRRLIVRGFWRTTARVFSVSSMPL